MQQKTIQFIQQTFTQTGLSKAVIGVSGGIDSAVSLTLLARSLPAEAITPVILPYGKQDMTDAIEICDWNNLAKQLTEINIQPMVETTAKELQLSVDDLNPASKVRLGNIMARTRMMILFDMAKATQALVVGTENKSENLLGYFTRFGDAASDLEPIAHLYKTQVYQLAQELKIPEKIITKPPSAGLWIGQTDEEELGFSYELADQVLMELEDQLARSNTSSLLDLVDEALSQPQIASKRAVLQQLKQNWFKQQVPYKIM